MKKLAEKNLIVSVLNLKCPKCRKGDLFCNKNSYQFKGFFNMYNNCAVCGQDLQIEVGFYYGAMYVSYALTIAIIVSLLTALYVFDIFAIELFLITDVLVLIATLPYVFKVSRAIWIAIMIKYDPKA
ncbi:MAG: DUF983 domain-containing protein [Flavobacteriales bacterium]|nr:DUF983 domain-containing protein [Flavobacteriales bacterium]